MDRPRRRLLKGMDLVQHLQERKQQKPRWTKQVMREISEETGLSYGQVYKWNWQFDRLSSQGQTQKIVGTRVFWEKPS